jgi:hypothetical protein
MIKLYPNRFNLGPLWYSGVGLLSQPSADKNTKSSTDQ